MKLDNKFYAKNALELANDLLGKVLVHKIDGNILKGKIVETEAYIAAIDKASHAYNGRKTERVAPLYEKAGTTYVYFIYGMHYCFNVVAGKKGEAEGVLIRGLEPIEGLDYMAKIRNDKKYSELTKAQKRNLTNGPSKLCKALSINKNNNCESLIGNNNLYIEDIGYNDFEIVRDKRVGIDYAEEAKDFLWRFYIKDNEWVSKRK